MTESPTPSPREAEAPGDPVLDRIRRDRRPGEIESGMMSGSDEGGISATERFAGELSPEEALQVLDPEGTARDPE
ncbi:MAG TPA: hypothetical protein VK689_12135 [Armatimonadota bacterium]|nr:hypothetical protein [Armatimonadota bacterium]